MKDHALQLMIHGKDIGRDTVVRISYPGVSLRRVQRAESPNYLFLDLYIGPEARPGTVRIARIDATRMVHLKSFSQASEG